MFFAKLKEAKILADVIISVRIERVELQYIAAVKHKPVELSYNASKTKVFVCVARTNSSIRNSVSGPLMFLSLSFAL